MTVPQFSLMNRTAYRRTTAASHSGSAQPVVPGSRYALAAQPGQRLRSFTELLDHLLAQRAAGPALTPSMSPASIQSTGTGAVSSITGVAPTSRASRLDTASRPMALADFPRPANDNGRGIHWIPTGTQSKEVVDRFVREADDMKIKWVTFLHDDSAIGTNDYLVQQLAAKGIEPVMRVYTPNGRPIEGDLGAMVRHYRNLGVHYFQLYNEPNNNGENVDGQPNVDRYLDQWTAAAKVVSDNGGLPGFGALSPGGNVNDLQFLDTALDRLAKRGQTHLLDRAWLSIHNYSFNRPIDYTGDTHSYLKFRLYRDILQRHLGRDLPMIGTEGGTHPGDDFDKRYPTVDENRQAQLVADGYRYLKQREPYYFAYSYWIIANELGGGPEPAWSKHALFQPGKTSPIVDILKRMD